MSNFQISAISEILEQSIAIEEGIGELYKLFASYYQEDTIFWSCLSKEEKTHANILSGLRPWIAMGGKIDQYLLPNLKELKEQNAAIKKVIQHARDERPNREIAFNLAHKLELTAAELHYQKIITKNADSKLLLSMQELCNADKDHLKRIRTMMNSLNIKLMDN